MYDLILKGKLSDHHIKKGDKIIFASVGAGMHINAMVYQY
jgi:3-oxoacyl-[acyl-carrier-protein] synthase-3